MSKLPFGDLTPDDLTRLLREIEASKLVEVEIDYGDLHIRVRKDATGETSPSPPSTQRSSKVRSLEGSNPMRGKRVEVRAPMLGVFYRAPRPGTPPFVEVGQSVSAKDAIGLIEVMKLFNQVPAGVDGRVVEIVAADATMLEFGQLILVIEAVE